MERIEFDAITTEQPLPGARVVHDPLQDGARLGSLTIKQLLDIGIHSPDDGFTAFDMAVAAMRGENAATLEGIDDGDIYI